MTSWCGAQPSECECSVGGVVVGLFLLKTSPEVVCLFGIVGVWVTTTGAFLFCAKDSLGRLKVVLIFLVSSTSLALLMLNNMLSGKVKKKKD